MISRARGLMTLLILTASLVGCGDDDGGSGLDAGGNDAGGGEDSGGIPDPFLYEDVLEPYADGDVAACKAFTQADGDLDADLVKRRRDCYCDTCFDLMRQCDALPGCAEIRQCQWQSNCASAVACYLVPGAPCKAVIDLWANTSVSTGLSSELQTQCTCP